MDNATFSDQLSSLTLKQALAWLAWNDRNGTWSEYLEDFRWAVGEYGPITVAECREVIFEQCDGENPGNLLNPGGR